MNDTLPTGIRLEVLASNDLGLQDPWLAIASKTDSAAWTGPGVVQIDATGEGKVEIEVRDLFQSPAQHRRFFRLRLSMP